MNILQIIVMSIFYSPNFLGFYQKSYGLLYALHSLINIQNYSQFNRSESIQTFG